MSRKKASLHLPASALATMASRSARSTVTVAQKSGLYRPSVSETLKRLQEAGGSIAWQGEKLKVIGRLHFLVRSKTSMREWHCVDLEPVDADWPEGGCTCRGYNCRRTCRHHTAVLSFVKAIRDGELVLPPT
jgi:hypothetical protein